MTSTPELLFVNLFDVPQKKWNVGAAWAAAVVWRSWHWNFSSSKLFVLCGKKVAAAFGHDLPYFAMQVPLYDPFWAMAIPHPSGRNLWWNKSSNVELAKHVLRDLMTWLDIRFVGGTA